MARPRLVLASASPRRRELLGWLGYPFEAIATDITEQISPGIEPGQAARDLARAKAETLEAAVGSTTVIGADTVVVLDGDVLGKPADAAEARRMLRRLRGRDHEVLTGIVVLPAVPKGQIVRTVVRMRNYTDAEIEAYVQRGEVARRAAAEHMGSASGTDLGPFDKAGAYGIQDPEFRPVAAIHGCYCNVVGLPLGVLSELLIASGVDLPRTAATACARFRTAWCVVRKLHGE